MSIPSRPKEAPTLKRRPTTRSGRAKPWSDASNSPNSKIFPDEDPPFFLKRRSNSSSGEFLAAPPNLKKNDTKDQWNNVATGIPNDDSLDSTVRSIIDDLTVENRLLKAKNQNFEKRGRYGKELDKDKLFEVTLHNISSSDAKELEELLRNFVNSRNIPGGREVPPPQEDREQPSLAEITGKAGKDASAFKKSSKDASSKAHATQSGGSSSNHVDSGYASMSMTPGQRSSSFQMNKAAPLRHKTARLGKYSVLNDVPPGLLPRHPRSVTERSKKKMVVERLEELFTGKKILHPKRNSSLRTERSTNTSGLVDHGQEPIAVEGSREANIMNASRAFALKDGVEATRSKQQETSSEAEADEMDSDELPQQQRPTRLLDLDPQRQQIPSENVDYLRHLGVSTPNLQSENTVEAEVDADGWVYLNLLMNMAQLHIMNVTVDFVRDAVEDVSSKFQLSNDGRRLRWKGGQDPTAMSSISGSSTEHHSHAESSESAGDNAEEVAGNDDQQVEDISSVTSESSSEEARECLVPRLMKGRKAVRARQRHIAYYSPIFAHRSLQNSTTSLGLETPSNNNVEAGQKRMASNTRLAPATKRRRTSNDRYRGITFYDKAPFFLDISGDANWTANQDLNFAGYDDGDVLGCTTPRAERRGSPSLNSQYLATLKYWGRMLARDSVLRSPKFEMPAVSDLYLESDLGVYTNFDDEKATPLMQFPLPMDASCLGATVPYDHFHCLARSRLHSKKHKSRRSKADIRWQRLVAKIPSLRPGHDSDSDVSDSEEEPEVNRKIFDVNYRQLESSSRPTPGLFFTESSASTSTSDDGCSGSETCGSPGQIFSRAERAKRNSQPTSRLYEQHLPKGALSINGSDMISPSLIRMLRREMSSSSTESSGVGEEEDDDTSDSVDMSQYPRKVEREKRQDADEDDSMSLEAVAWTEGEEESDEDGDEAMEDVKR